MVELKHNQKVYRLPTEEEKKWCAENDFDYYTGTDEMMSQGHGPDDWGWEEVQYTVFYSNARRRDAIHSEDYECEGCGCTLALIVIAILVLAYFS